jgi:phosphotransferase system IIA component
VILQLVQSDKVVRTVIVTNVLLFTHIGMHTIQLKSPCIKFHDNLSSGSCTVTHGQKEEKTDTEKLILKFILANSHCEWAKFQKHN